jgi:hypothetical protein
MIELIAYAMCAFSVVATAASNKQQLTKIDSRAGSKLREKPWLVTVSLLILIVVPLYSYAHTGE